MLGCSVQHFTALPCPALDGPTGRLPSKWIHPSLLPKPSIPTPNTRFPDPLRTAGRTKPTQTRSEPPRERVLAERRYLYVLPVLFLEYLALRSERVDLRTD